MREALQTVQQKIEELNGKIETGKNTIIDALNQRATIKSKMGRYDTMLEPLNVWKKNLSGSMRNCAY